jgi:hypothetical protein
MTVLPRALHKARSRPRARRQAGRFIRPWLIPLEDRTLPSVLDVTAAGALTWNGFGDGTANAVTLQMASQTFTFADSAEAITLTPGAVAMGWSHPNNDPNTAQGPVDSTNDVTITGGVNPTAPDTLAVISNISFSGTVSVSAFKAISISRPLATTGGVTLSAATDPAASLRIMANVTAQGSATLTGRANIVVAGAVSAGQDTVLTGNAMNITGAIGAGKQKVSLVPFAGNVTTDLGTDSAGNLGLTNAELGKITAGELEIGGQGYAGAIQVTDGITAPAGWNTLHLATAGAIAETSSGSLNVDSLAAEGDAGVDLTQSGNRVGTLAGKTVTKPFSFVDAVTLTVGEVAGVSGIRTVAGPGPGGNIALCVGSGDLNLTAPVNAGTNTVGLQADAGSVIQDSAGVITAGNLGVKAAGNIGLCAATNHVTGSFAANASGAGNAIQFLSDAGFTVDAVGAFSCFGGATGATAVDGDVSLNSGGDLTLRADVSGDTVGLEAAGSVLQFESSPGITTAVITATNLGVIAGNGFVELCLQKTDGTINHVTGAFAADAGGAGSFVHFADDVGITVDAVPATVCFAGATGASAGGAVALRAKTGDILLKADVSGDTVGLEATAGSVRQNAAGQGKISAAQLGVIAGDGGVELCLTINHLTGAFAATASGATSFVHFWDDSTITVNQVGALPCFAGATGVTAAVELSLRAKTGNVVLQADVSAAKVGLQATAGSVLQDDVTPGVVNAGQLGVYAKNGFVELCVKANNVAGDFAANAGTYVHFWNTSAIAVDTVGPFTCFAGAMGATGAGEVTMRANAGDILLNADVSGGTVGLEATAGSVRQNAAGVGKVTAGQLGVVAGSGGIELCLTVNHVTGAFAADAGGAGSFVHFADDVGITVDAVPATACFAGATGAAASGEVTLRAGAGDILLKADVSGGTVGLEATAGSVRQNAAGQGKISAAQLGVIAGDGVIDLCLTVNHVASVFAAKADGAGNSIRFWDDAGFTVDHVDPVPCFSGVTGVTASDGDVSLKAVNGNALLDVHLSKPVTASDPNNKGRTVRLTAGGKLDQTPAGAITATNLGIIAGGPVHCCTADNVVSGTLAALVTLPGSSLGFSDTKTFTVAVVPSDPCFAGAAGVATNNGDITLASGGSLTLAQQVTAGGGVVRLGAGTSVAQTGVGIITGSDLGVLAGGDILLDQVANQIGKGSGVFAAKGGGKILFFNAYGFVVGQLSGKDCFPQVIGVVSNAPPSGSGDIVLCTQTGDIILKAPVNAGVGTVRLKAAGGVSQQGDGVITAGALSVGAAGGDVALDLDNVVSSSTEPGTFAAALTKAGAALTFRDAASANVYQLSGESCADAVYGVSTKNGNATLNVGMAVFVSPDANANHKAIDLGTGQLAITYNLDLLTGPVNATFDEGSVLAGSAQLTGGAAAASNVLNMFYAAGTTFNILNSFTGSVQTSKLTEPNATPLMLHFDNIQTFTGGVGDDTFNLGSGNNLDAFTSPVAVSGGDGQSDSDTLFLDDLSAKSAHTYAVNSTAIQRDQGIIVSSYTSIENLYVKAGSADDTFNVLNTLAQTVTRLFGGAGNDTVNVSLTQNLTNVAGPVIVDGEAANPVPTTVFGCLFNAGNVVNVLDQANDADSTFWISPGGLSRSGTTGQVFYGNVQLVVVYAGAGNDSFNVALDPTPPPATTDLAVDGGPGSNTLNFTNLDKISNVKLNPDQTLAGAGSVSSNGNVIFCYQNIGRIPKASYQVASFLLPSKDQTGKPKFEIFVSGSEFIGETTLNNTPFAPVVAQPTYASPYGFSAPNLAVGDVNQDGVPDLIVGLGTGYAPLVTVLNGADIFRAGGANSPNIGVLAQFFAYTSSFSGGVYVAAANLTGGKAGITGEPDVITGAGRGGGPHVEAFEYQQPKNGGPFVYNSQAFPGGGVGPPVRSFMAYTDPAGAPTCFGGVRVAAGDVGGGGHDDIITGAGVGCGPHVKVFDGPNNSVLASFMAYGTNFFGGIYVAAGDYDGAKDASGRTHAEIMTGAGFGGGPHVKIFDGSKVGSPNFDPTTVQGFFAFPSPSVASYTDAIFPGANPLFAGVSGVAFNENEDGRLDIFVGSGLGQPAEERIFPDSTHPIDPNDPGNSIFFSAQGISNTYAPGADIFVAGVGVGGFPALHG